MCGLFVCSQLSMGVACNCMRVCAPVRGLLVCNCGEMPCAVVRVCLWFACGIIYVDARAYKLGWFVRECLRVSRAIRVRARFVCVCQMCACTCARVQLARLSVIVRECRVQLSACTRTRARLFVCPRFVCLSAIVRGCRVQLFSCMRA